MKRFDAGYLWSLLSVAACSGLFSLARAWLEKGQASLLYLPVVIACSIYFGFGPAVVAAVLSFLCWDFFFLPPFHTLTIAEPNDWLSLLVFLVAAVTTARLASQAREQTAQARAREAELAILFQASETLSGEVSAARVISLLSEQLQRLCDVSECFVWRSTRGPRHRLLLLSRDAGDESDPGQALLQLADAAVEHNQIIGFDKLGAAHWDKAVAPNAAMPVGGAFVPLQVENQTVGVLYVGSRRDGKPFPLRDQSLILTLANHAAVVIARESLAEQAAEAEALREADRLKDSLLSMVSHELRSPLAAIKVTATDLIARSTAPENGDREALLAINTEADRLATLVSNLLDLSRLEAGAWRPEKDWCDVGEIFATALDRLEPPQADRVRVTVARDTPLFRADYTQIALVVTNLLQNAVKYTPEARPIELTAGPDYNGSDEAAAGVIIRVRDCGDGIAPGDEELIFGRFYRSVLHRNSSAHGTGLGLALCRSIVGAHHGRMWAANAPAGEEPGAIFSVVLPRE